MGLFIYFFFFERFSAIGCVRSPDRQRDIETESEKSSPRGHGHAAIPSPPFSSRDLGHARTRARSEFFKPLGSGREPWSTMWESCDIAITLTAGPSSHFLTLIFYSSFNDLIIVFMFTMSPFYRWAYLSLVCEIKTDTNV